MEKIFPLTPLPFSPSFVPLLTTWPQVREQFRRVAAAARDGEKDESFDGGGSRTEDRAEHVEVLRRSLEQDYQRAETLRREMRVTASEEANFTATQLRAALLTQGDELVRLYMRAVAGARHVLDFDARVRKR